MISMVDSLVQFENCQFDLYGPSQFSLSVWLFVQFPILIWVVVYQYSYVWLFINMIIFQLCLSVYHYCYCLVVYQYNHSNFIYQFITAAICFRMISFPYCSISICLISLVVDPCMVGSVVVTASFVGIASFLSLPHLVTASGHSHCPTPRPPLFCRSMLHCSWAVLLLLFCCFCFLLHALCPIPLPPLFCLFANAHASVCSIWWSMLYAPCRSILCWFCLLLYTLLSVSVVCLLSHGLNTQPMMIRTK